MKKATWLAIAFGAFSLLGIACSAREIAGEMSDSMSDAISGGVGESRSCDAVDGYNITPADGFTRPPPGFRRRRERGSRRRTAQVYLFDVQGVGQVYVASTADDDPPLRREREPARRSESREDNGVLSIGRSTARRRSRAPIKVVATAPRRAAARLPAARRRAIGPARRRVVGRARRRVACRPAAGDQPLAGRRPSSTAGFSIRTSYPEVVEISMRTSGVVWPLAHAACRSVRGARARAAGVRVVVVRR